MNHVLFKVVELEERFRATLETGGPIDRIVSEAQLKTFLNIIQFAVKRKQMNY